MVCVGKMADTKFHFHRSLITPHSAFNLHYDIPHILTFRDNFLQLRIRLQSFEVSLHAIDCARVLLKSPLIIVDGANIIYNGSIEDGAVPSADRLIALMKALVVINQKVVAVLPKRLKAKLGDRQWYDLLKYKLLSLKILNDSVDDDLSMLALAKMNNGTIISNDRFRDWTTIYPQLTKLPVIRYALFDKHDLKWIKYPSYQIILT